MLLHEFYPNDIRVNKEAFSLLDEGFEIHLICLGRKKELKEEVVNGIQVHRIPIAQSFFWRGIWDIILAVNFFQRKFYSKLKSLHAKYQFDAIHVHDLPLSKTALAFKRRHKVVKVVLDFHENYPEALSVWFTWKKNPLIRWKNKLFFGYNRWIEYEQWVAQKCDLILVVVDEMKSRLVSVHNIQASKIFVITNSEPKSFLNQSTVPDIYGVHKDKFVLAYTGNVGPHRGVDIAVKSLKYLKDYPEIRLEITGALSAASRNWLNDLAVKDDVMDKMSINGRQPFERFFSYMKFASVNLIPHNRNGHTDNTIPHKLYQGMLTGNPVLVSSAPPLKRVVEKIDSGLVFEAGNPEDFADKVKKLYLDKGLYQKLGHNGYQATYYGEANWESTGKELVSTYIELLKTAHEQ